MTAVGVLDYRDRIEQEGHGGFFGHAEFISASMDERKILKQVQDDRGRIVQDDRGGIVKDDRSGIVKDDRSGIVKDDRSGMFKMTAAGLRRSEWDI